MIFYSILIYFYGFLDERILEYDIDKVVFEQQSPYQKVQIVHSKSLGNLLVLDELQSELNFFIHPGEPRKNDAFANVKIW